MRDTTGPVPTLEARLAASERRQLAIERELAVLRHTRALSRRRPRGARALGALLVAVLLAAVPLALVAATPFTDLTPGSVHNADIDIVYNAGVARGCTPTTYCPGDPVTREQLATFLARLGGLGNNPPVVNAATLGGVTLAELQAGAQGPPGPQGDPGPPGVATDPTIRTGTATVAAGGGEQNTAHADCVAGEVVIGGGHSIAPMVTSVSTLASYASTATRWTVTLGNGTGTAFVITAYALCIPTP